MNHHGYYAGHIPKASHQAFSETSDSEYYSETTTTSGIGEEEYKYCDRSTYITPPAQPPTTHILLEASKNPSFPKLTVVKPFHEVQNCETKQNAVNSISSQIKRWDNKNEDQGQRRQHLPTDRTNCQRRTTQCGPGPQQGTGQQQNRTTAHTGALQHPNNAITMVTATASVTVAVHPSLPGSYQGYMHEGFEDNESDSFNDSKRTSHTYGKATHYKKDSLELQDLNSTEKDPHQANQMLGCAWNQAAKDC